MKEFLSILNNYSSNDDTRMAHAMLAICRYAANRYYNASVPLGEDDLSFMLIAISQKNPGEIFKSWCVFMSERLCDECTIRSFVNWLSDSKQSVQSSA